MSRPLSAPLAAPALTTTPVIRRTFLASVAAGITATVSAPVESSAAETSSAERSVRPTRRRRRNRPAKDKKRGKRPNKPRKPRKPRPPRDPDSPEGPVTPQEPETPPDPVEPNPDNSSDAITQLTGLTPGERHLIRRFSYGLNAQLVESVSATGGALAWFERQLEPTTVQDDLGDQLLSWYPALALTPQQSWQRFTTDRGVTSSSSSIDLARWTLMRRLSSNRQVLEVMTEFWSNLLHVASPNEKSWVHRFDYDATVRRHALGRFDELLAACALHPAMLLYLDNYASTKDAPNENLGREVLECHTVGREALYTERDVLNSTRILTGFAVDRSGSWKAYYNHAGHYTGEVRVLGFRSPNASPDGRAVAHDFLNYLAHHPATAQRIAQRLVARFVSDDPSPTLVRDVARAFSESGTDIRATLRAMVAHPEFQAKSMRRVRTPSQDYVATCRALRMTPQPPSTDTDFARHCVWQASNMGQRPFDWPTPDGFPEAGIVWASTARMLGSWNVHTALAAGTPKTGVQHRSLADWTPEALPMSFAKFVTHVCAQLLYEPISPSVQRAAARAVGVSLDDVVSADHRLLRERMHMLLCCLLDSPLHMTY